MAIPPSLDNPRTHSSVLTNTFQLNKAFGYQSLFEISFEVNQTFGLTGFKVSHPGL